MKVPNDFEPVKSNFTEGERIENLVWIKADHPKKYYPEFSKPCKYRSCLHVKEDGCEIIELVNKGKIPGWRYDNYIKFIDEVSK